MKIGVRLISGRLVLVEANLDTAMDQIRQAVEQELPGGKVTLTHEGVMVADGFTVQDLELLDGVELIGVVKQSDMTLRMSPASAWNRSQEQFDIVVAGSASLADMKKACGWSSCHDVQFRFEGRPLSTEGTLSDSGVHDGALIHYGDSDDDGPPPPLVSDSD
mmetsp:Transcript_78277/g.155117  ORF Transcript_78277/g.155117 Transcript_78277/m.155117 type:complete len:162 (+) Transcript_78277:71-556(+)